MKSLDSIMRIVLFGIFLILFGFGVFLSTTSKSVDAATTYTAGVLCLIFVFLPSFQSFEGLGIKAKLLDQKIEESDAVIKRLQKMLILMASMLFSLSARMGRWGSAMPRSDRYHLTEQIEKEFLANGISNQELENAKADLHRYNMIDLYVPLFKRLRELSNKKGREFAQKVNSISSTKSPEEQIELNSLTNKKEDAEKFVVALENIISIDDFESMPIVFDDLIKTCLFLTKEEKAEILQELKDEISDFKYYASQHQFRRLDVWLSKNNRDA